MFNKDEKQTKEAETVIGASVKVKGAFVSKGDIIIDGEFEGSLETTNNILIGESAIITANIIGTNATIQGKLTGDVVLRDKLELGRNAIITGDIECENISILSGAIVNGKISMRNTESRANIE